MTSKELIEMCKQFSYGCLDISLTFPPSDLGRHVGRQLMRAATSVAANYRAACRAQTKVSFIAKLNIPIEESDECIYWLTLALDRDLADKVPCQSLIKESNELLSIFIATQKRAKDNHNSSNRIES